MYMCIHVYIHVYVYVNDYVCVYIYVHVCIHMELPRWCNLPVQDMQETQVWVGQIPWRRAQKPTPVFLPGESHGQRSPVGYIP